MTCSPPFRRVTGLPEDIPRRPRQRRRMKAIGVWARLHAEACSAAWKVTAKTGRRNIRVYGPAVEIRQKGRNVEEAGVLSSKASLGKFGKCRLIVARSWVGRAWPAPQPRPVQALTVLSPTALPAIALTR